jgi:hypothetical protein
MFYDLWICDDVKDMQSARRKEGKTSEQRKDKEVSGLVVLTKVCLDSGMFLTHTLPGRAKPNITYECLAHCLIFATI